MKYLLIMVVTFPGNIQMDTRTLFDTLDSCLAFSEWLTQEKHTLNHYYSIEGTRVKGCVEIRR